VLSRHERDGLSLMGGLLLVLVAGLFLLHDLTSVDIDGRWVGPGVLIAVGLVGLGSTLRRSRPRPDAEEVDQL
jgi:hypothetical protein